jgi:hypothetical protein
VSDVCQVPGCLTLAQACGVGGCCAGLVCRSEGPSPASCCVDTGGSCQHSGDCCGARSCMANKCCVNSSQPCDSNSDCCSGTCNLGHLCT